MPRAAWAWEMRCIEEPFRPETTTTWFATPDATAMAASWMPAIPLAPADVQRDREAQVGRAHVIDEVLGSEAGPMELGMKPSTSWGLRPASATARVMA